MPAIYERLVAGALLILFVGCCVHAQEASSTTQELTQQRTEEPDMSQKQQMRESSSLDLSPALQGGTNFRSNVWRDFLEDQKELWTSPAKLRFSDTEWLVPVAGITAGLFASDAQFSRHLSNDPKTLRRYSTLSNAGLAGLAGGVGAMWLWSHRNHNSHWQETGYLATKAAVNSLVLSESMKYALGRARPSDGAGGGGFFQGGVSFPSEHTAAAWSIASVVAHE